MSGRARVLTLVVLLATIVGAFTLLSRTGPGAESPTQASQPKLKAGIFYPTAAQWAALTIEPIQELKFRSEVLTDGKVAVAFEAGSRQSDMAEVLPQLGNARCNRTGAETRALEQDLQEQQGSEANRSG
jgi:hypothetical protein